MPHPLEATMKYILQKDFNYEKFIGKMFNDFWHNLLDYVKSNNKGSFESDLKASGDSKALNVRSNAHK